MRVPQSNWALPTETIHPDSRRVRAFSQRALTPKMIDDLCSGLAADEGREFFDRGDRDFLYRTELPQQTSLAFISHAGNCRQFRSEIAQFAALAMISNGVTMSLVADHLNQAKYQRVRIEIDRLVFAS